MINLKKRIERLERQARIRARRAAAEKWIAQQEKLSRRRVADWRRRQANAPDDANDLYFTCYLQEES